MLAARLYGQNDIRIDEVDIPEINDNEILLKVKSAAICGTDMRMYQNGYRDVDESNPLTLGHELSGVIHKVGKNVSAYEEGMRVAVGPNMGCGTCNQCVSGNTHLCPDYEALGINLPGGFAEYVRIPEKAVRQGNVSVIGDNVSFEAAALNEPLSCAYNAFLRADIRPGDTVLIIGAGPIGLMHAKLSLMAGATVLLNDLYEEKLEKSKELEPSIITVTSEELKDKVAELTGGLGVDVCITANPAPSAQQIALELAAINGRIIFFGGLPQKAIPVPLDTNLIHYKQLIVSGTTRASISQYRQTLDFIQNGLFEVDSLVSHKFGLKDIIKAIEKARSGQNFRVVINFNN